MRRPARQAGILVIALLVVVAGCDSADAGPSGAAVTHPASLAGTSWVVLTVAGQTPVAGAAPSLEFSDVRVGGSGGCNRVGGGYRYDPSTGRLEFADLAMTLVGCVDDRRNRVETAFMQALNGPLGADLDVDGHLVLVGSAGVIVLAPPGQPLATD